ncbi:cytoplasmic phosphatidylinositol transfer protein 1b [Syngnathus scovelli]|uniref:cytoplasmic phosphatidylinositol transfer protein 1b n=1 Tax=Syngnathus scovelli TaxID=161590 RepID=UPI002110AE7C|nr:cytoplasmic phosphatidylinositol transfer protein 1b [Syngnathus scovelli]
MLEKEYRICMPLTVEEYRIGQLYMISKHSCEQSENGEGVEVVRNEADTHPEHGPGQVTEKRIYLSSKLPAWAKSLAPRFFYVKETAWNFYPHTITEYSLSFLPKFSIYIETRFENNNGCNDNIFGTPTPAEHVSFLDILSDPIPEKHYKESEDLSHWQSSKTKRGPLKEGWREEHQPIMCSYKRVRCNFEVYGLQTKTEDFLHRNIRDILLIGHRQAVAWVDEWHGLTLEEVRQYEDKMQKQTNSKVKPNSGAPTSSAPMFSRSMSVTDECTLKKMGASEPSGGTTVPHGHIRLNSTSE